MLAFKNGQMSLYYHFNKIIKGPGTSLQSPALSQKHVKIVCHPTNYYFTKFYFDSVYLRFKKSNYNCNFHHVAMSMMTSQILKSGFHRNTKI